MAVITVNVSHLCIFSLLMLSVMANVMELTPLCGTMDGSSPKDSDKIYFKDKNQRIRTVEVNGTIYACYPDGTMVEPNSSSSAESSGERTITGPQLNGSQLIDRIRDGNHFGFLKSDFVFFSHSIPSISVYHMLIIIKSSFFVFKFNRRTKPDTTRSFDHQIHCEFEPLCHQQSNILHQRRDLSTGCY